MILIQEAQKLTKEAQAQAEIREQENLKKEYEAIDNRILNVAKNGGSCVWVESNKSDWLEPYREAGYLVERDLNGFYINWSGKLMFPPDPPAPPVVKKSFLTKIWNYFSGFFK